MNLNNLCNNSENNNFARSNADFVLIENPITWRVDVVDSKYIPKPESNVRVFVEEIHVISKRKKELA